jgi:hypothetical protein
VDGAEKWFEFGFIWPCLLSGDAARGWVDDIARVRVWVEWSEDLTNWRTAMFSSLPGSPQEVEGGWEYWMRSALPVDSAEKRAAIVASSTAARGYWRNNPFTAFIVASVPQLLPNFPYEMPGDAAQLQADLRAEGWSGATVTASSDVDWSISIPDVYYGEFGTFSRVEWPIYASGSDPFGNPLYSSNQSLTGAWLNNSGTRTFVPKQFARIGIAPL